MLESAMQLAIQSARQGVKENDGGPFGAVIVRNNQVISVAHNTVLKDHDPTCHAEMNAIRKACKHLNTHILKDCELYTTTECCPMCFSAIYWARIPKIYIGTPKSIAAQYDFDDVLIYEELAKPLEKRLISCQTGIMMEEVESVFKEWKALERVLY